MERTVGGNEPRKAEDGADDNYDCQNQEIEMISSTFDQAVFFSVHDDCSDLLVHKDKNRG